MSDPEKTPPVLDPDEVGAFAFQVWSYKQGEMVSLMIHLGDRLGLYRALEGAGPLTAAELAAMTGLNERWLLEWLKGQAAAKLLAYHGDERFELTPTGAAVLADEDGSLAFAAGAFGGGFSRRVVDGLAEAFRTGVGLTYDDQGPEAAHRTERMLGPWARLALVPTILPALDGVVAKLEAGARVADVGCGAGVALFTMAQAFPASSFVGYDPSQHAIERARVVAAEQGLGNVELEALRGEEVPAGADFDLVITFDCLHDMTRPDLVMRAIRAAIAADGTWLIKEIKSHPEYEKNFRNPMLAMMYGFSVSSCMSSALSEPGGLGLGTLGLHPQKARAMTAEAGFGRFEEHDFDDPANLYYEVRP
ncbi:MAG: class I SAM-dependent methyltransferase [Thermoanaerobaculia bacterium]|nr:class I SAM-dependent methyltransferase [Thermoanaerobaculia bacterium]